MTAASKLMRAEDTASIKDVNQSVTVALARRPGTLTALYWRAVAVTPARKAAVVESITCRSLLSFWCERIDSKPGRS